MIDNKNKKPLISLDDLIPREKIKGGEDKGKRIFGSFDELKDKNKTKDRF